MTRTTVRPLVALVASRVGSRGSLVGSLAHVGWLASLVGALVCGLAGGVAGVAGGLVLVCGFAGGLAGVAGGRVAAFFGRRPPAVVYLGHDPHHGSRLSCSPLCTWGMTRTTVPVLHIGHTAKILLTNNADDDRGNYAMVIAMTMN